MTKRITFTTEPKPPIPPVVPSIKIDISGDVEINLTRDDKTISLGYICSDTGTLVRYGIGKAQALEFGIETDSHNRLVVSG